MTQEQKPLADRQLAEVAQVPLRVFQRVKYVLANGIPELIEALEDDRIGSSPAERIARLPHDRQLAELESHLNRTPSKRPDRTVYSDMERIGGMVDSMAEKWSEQDRRIAGCILADIGNRLMGKVGE